MRKIFRYFLEKAGKLTNRVFVYIPSARFGKVLTAVKADAGFWYAGNLADRSDIAYGIWHNGQTEAEGTALVQKILEWLRQQKSPLAFYDIGANTGYFGVMAAFLGQGATTVYSFEPLSEYNQVELESLKLNRLENYCKIFNLALGNSSGRSEIFLAGSGSSLRPGFSGRDSGLPKRMVNQSRLDDVVAEGILAPPDFIKMDVEGFEYPVLQGAKETLTRALPVIWYESALTIIGSNIQNKDFIPAQDLLKSLGYRIFILKNGKLLEPGPLYKYQGIDMYLALHSLKHLELIKILAANDKNHD